MLSTRKYGSQYFLDAAPFKPRSQTLAVDYAYYSTSAAEIADLEKRGAEKAGDTALDVLLGLIAFRVILSAVATW